MLTQASNQWATRPADERFASLNQMYLATFMAAQESRQRDIDPTQLRVEIDRGNLFLDGTPAGPMQLSHYAFNQLSARIGAPASYLRDLHQKGRTDLVAMNINAGLQSQSPEDNQVQMYYRENDTLPMPKLLALTSTRYGRIYNHEIVQALMGLKGNWRNPPAMPASVAPNQPKRLATAADVGPWTNVSLGQEIVDSGLYASDKDMFAFLIDPERRIRDGSEGGLSRGFFIKNSEVGDATFELWFFWFRFVCMNNNVWGAEDVQRLTVKHLGRGARGRAFNTLEAEVKKFAEASVEEDERKIVRAQSLVLGANLEDVQDLVFGQKRITSKKNVAEAYEITVQNEKSDGNPNTAWGLAQGLTRLSQRSLYTDDRVSLDLAAGRVLALAA